MAVDFRASEPQFVDHLAPVYLALPPSERGSFIVPAKLLERAARRGVLEATTELGDRGRPIVIASHGDQRRARDAGRTIIARMEHGAGQSYPGDRRSVGHPSYAGGVACDIVSLFLTPNEYSARLWREAYPDATVAVVGSPKLDQIPERTVSRETTIAVSFHFDGLLVQETRATFGTFRPVLAGLAERFRVIGHGHPRFIAELANYYRRLGIEVVPDFADVMARADLYVCDNSSTIFEAATRIPVVVLNEAEGRIANRGFRRSVHHGLRFWEAATVGIQVDRPELLGDAIAAALDDPAEQRAARETALDLVYAYRTGAPDRAATAIGSWAATKGA